MNDSLKLGVAVRVITPKVGCALAGYRANHFSKSVNDDLTATAFVFSQGGKLAVMLSMTLCGMSNKVTADLFAAIEKAHGIKKEQCILHCIHTHSGPNLLDQPGWGGVDEEYFNGILVPAVIACIGEAMGNMTAVKMGVASGMSYVGINRRKLHIDNTAGLSQNPWGPFNPEMTVISFKNNDNNTVASMVHYGCHPTASGCNTEITRDWPGVMIDVLSEISGAPVAFFNGLEGDVGPRLANGGTTGSASVRYALEHGAVAAQDAVRIFRDIRTYRDVTLDFISDTIELPLDPLMDYEEAKAQYEQYKDSDKNIHQKKAAFYRKVITLHENGYESKPSRLIDQNIIRIGDVAFVGFPAEPFSEIGMRIARDSNVPRTLPLSNTNGKEGYFPTEDQLCRGGYEVEMFKSTYDQPYADDTDWHMVTETLKNLKKLDDKGE